MHTLCIFSLFDIEKKKHLFLIYSHPGFGGWGESPGSAMIQYIPLAERVKGLDQGLNIGSADALEP